MGKVKDFYQDEIERQAAEEPFPRGPGDPDAFGYPGQPEVHDEVGRLEDSANVESVNMEGVTNDGELPF
jgi:hypothetical protein